MAQTLPEILKQVHLYTKNSYEDEMELPEMNIRQATQAIRQAVEEAKPAKQPKEWAGNEPQL